VKVSIRDYMPPYTAWMQVELEDGLCAGSARFDNEENGIEEHGFGENTHPVGTGEEAVNGVINYELDNGSTWK
ncbi:MAG: hypothetical protein HUJ98_13855, partial [Bacteroidaceae bacterium]|nr:hypothetical protein [Bacteroidaceae bacterium]